MKKSYVDDTDVERLAAHILGVTHEYSLLEPDDRTEFIEWKFLDKFDIPLNSFSEILEYLLPLVYVGRWPMSSKDFRGFAANHIWLIKEEIK